MEPKSVAGEHPARWGNWRRESTTLYVAVRCYGALGNTLAGLSGRRWAEWLTSLIRLISFRLLMT